ncbi:NAD(P)/FAD-dependent oxidoreductase [Neogemmobacter tilapiae]|uniref:Pyridine nucleotide-disulfide oxidoreductase n=1 Tax=Neogemmobacter tilapiae TaxID=875041 RepID=A0A918TQN1_9RHOB|nr:FAD-dependent oxidoreductase [Gemmobacter tilapiae]GHC55580.1 pyridine nucleotide-disulfide oxidoreductase [Gemmobacter tilapiae]
MTHIVAIGAGQAGAALVARLRSQGFDGQITLIGEEPVAPYQRPPLSKGYLLGEMGLDRLMLRSDEWYVENNITLRLGQPVESINTDSRTIWFSDNESLHYNELVLTTGSIPRRLPAAVGGDLAGVYTVRTLADVDAMRAEFQAGKRLLIVGGGYIGLEAAAVAAKLGVDVTLVEMSRRILSRVAAAETSDYFRNLHMSQGVMILEGVGLETLLGEGRVSGAKLSSGKEIPVDFVIAGVGILPTTRLAEVAGIEIDNGIKTDAQGRCSADHVWAAGDCASFPMGEGRMRLESVGNAIDQAELVADNLLGAGKDYVPAPWFWSDQYDTKLQIAGLSTGYDHIVTRGPAGDAVSFWYYQGDKLIAVDAMNDSRAYMVGKRLIESGKTADAAKVSDLSVELKSLLK